WVIHAAGMQLGGKATVSSLKSCTRASLEICRQHDISSVAFPAIGAGIGGLDIETCAQTMLPIARDHLTQFNIPKKIVFVLWERSSFEVFQRVVQEGLLDKMSKSGTEDEEYHG
ncbi:MAG: macro domain-containing protein, partial [bacterium]